MAYNETLDERLQFITSDWDAITRRKMFGGVGYMLHGNMVCGVNGDFLILRLGKAAADEALAQPGFKVFDITGRTMKGWVMAGASIYEDEAILNTWLEKAKTFALMLPKKG